MTERKLDVGICLERIAKIADRVVVTAGQHQQKTAIVERDTAIMGGRDVRRHSERFVIRSESFIESSKLQKSNTEPDPGLHDIGIDRESLVERCQSFVILSKPVESIPAAAPSFRHSGLESERLVVGVESRVVMLAQVVGAAARAPCLGAIGVDRERLVIRGQRLVTALERGQDIPSTDPRLRKIGFDRERRFEFGFGLSISFQTHEDVATGDPRFGKIGFDRERLVVSCQRVFMAPHVVKHISSCQECLHKARLDRQRLLEGGERLLVALQAAERTAAAMPRFSDFLTDRKNMIVNRESFAGALQIDQAAAFSKQGLEGARIGEDCALKVVQRHRQIALIAVHDSEAGECVHVRRLETNNALEMVLGPIQRLFLKAQTTEIILAIGRIRVRRDRSRQETLGLRQIAGLKLDEPEKLQGVRLRAERPSESYGRAALLWPDLPFDEGSSLPTRGSRVVALDRAFRIR